MNRRVAALALAGSSIALGLAASFGVASAAEGDGNCNNSGDNNVIVAPFCGANFGPSVAPVPGGPAATTTTTFFPGRPAPTTSSFTFTLGPFPPINPPGS
ncbi:hypothetical protein GCM10023200_39240 [Actinomycetospora chlora]|uniref:Uncharacterized protein n=1 Tax=Actinomycetospora chlora TaxID=663608 RepID=A0ABP9BQ79_9PSEU